MPLHRDLPRALPAVLTALLIVLTGCSGKDEQAPQPSEPAAAPVASPAQLVQAAAQAMRTLPTVQLVGDLAHRGQHRNLEVRSDWRGNCAGRVVERRGVVNFVVTATATYLDRGAGWVRFPAWTRFRQYCGLSGQLLSSLGDPTGFEPVNTPGFGDETTQTLRNRDDTTTTRVQIAVDAPHYVLSLIRTSPGRQVSVDFKPDGTTELYVPGPSEVTGRAGVPLPHTGF